MMMALWNSSYLLLSHYLLPNRTVYPAGVGRELRRRPRSSPSSIVRPNGTHVSDRNLGYE